MTRYTKNGHGHYLIHGHKYEALTGSRAQVMHGTAYKTSGGLKKGELMQNKNGRIVSRKKHTTAKRENRLVKAGFGTKKGHFGAVKLGAHTRSRRGSKKMRGGYSSGNNSQPGYIDSAASGVPAAPYVSGQYRASPAYNGGKGKRRHRRGGASASPSVTNSLSNAATSLSTAISKAVPMPGNLVSMPSSKA
jgi:hypothetical protein